jgi:hypothetical protein
MSDDVPQLVLGMGFVSYGSGSLIFCSVSVISLGAGPSTPLPKV